MAIDLTRAKAVIVVFVMEGCGACEEYLPRFKAQVAAARRRGQRINFYDDGSVPEGHVAVVVYDAASPDPSVQALANRFAVQGTPSTVVLPRGPGAFKVEGGVTNSQIQWILGLVD